MPQYNGARWGGGTNGRPAQVTWSFAEYQFTSLSTQYGGYVSFDSSISPAYRDAMRSAFAAWESVSGIDFVEVADTAASNIRVGNEYIDGLPAAGQSSTLAIARYWFDDGAFLTAQIYFDADAYERGNFYSTAVHEIGHTIGLNHSTISPAAVMYPSVNGQNISGTLQPDDIAGVQTLYGPVGQASAPPSAPDGVVASVQTAHQGILRMPASDAIASAVALEIQAGRLTMASYQNGLLDQASRSSVPALVIDSEVTGSIGSGADINYFTQAFTGLAASARALVPAGASPALRDAVSLQNAYQALAADLAGGTTTGASFRATYGEHLMGSRGDIGFVREIFQETFGIEPTFGANPNSNGNQYLRALTVLRDQVYRGNDTLAKGALLGQILYEAVENAPTSRIPSSARTLLLDAADGQVTLGRALAIAEPLDGVEMDEHVLWSGGSESEVPVLVGHDHDHQVWTAFA